MPEKSYQRVRELTEIQNNRIHSRITSIIYNANMLELTWAIFTWLFSFTVDMFSFMIMTCMILFILLQGETVNKIETTVDMTSTTIENTGSLLKEAQKMRKRNRHRKAKLITFSIIFLIIVALIIFLAVYFGT